MRLHAQGCRFAAAHLIRYRTVEVCATIATLDAPQPDAGAAAGPTLDDSLLLAATDALSGSLNLRRTAARLAHFVVEHIADAAMTTYRSGHHFEQVGVYRNSSSGAVTQRQARRDVGAAEPLVEVVVADGARAEWTASGMDVDVSRSPALLSEAGVTSGFVLPLRARGSVLGALAVGWEGRDQEPRSIQTLEALAVRAGLALDNCRLYNERSGAAKVLFTSVLPSRLPTGNGLDVGAHYATAAAQADVGGDFYDLFPLGPDRWGLVLGDVCGKGHEAAALAAEARHVVRACLVGGSDPVATLDVLNKVLNLNEEGRFCTAVVGVAAVDGNGVELSLSTGGHPAPYVVRSSGRVDSPSLGGSLIGVFDEVALGTVEIRLERGDSLVLCTDGVLEARSGSREFGERDFRQLLELCGGLPADALAARLVETVQTFAGGEQSDDLAVLVLRAVGDVR